MAKNWWDDVLLGALGKRATEEEQDNATVGAGLALQSATNVAEPIGSSEPQAAATGSGVVSNVGAGNNDNISTEQALSNRLAAPFFTTGQSKPRGVFTYGRPQVKHPSEFDFSASESIFDVFAKYQDRFDSYAKDVQAKSTGAFTSRAHYGVKERPYGSPEVEKFLADNPDYVQKTGKNIVKVKLPNGDIDVLKLAEDKSNAWTAIGNFAKTTSYGAKKGEWVDSVLQVKALEERLKRAEKLYGLEKSQTIHKGKYILLEQKRQNAEKLKKQFEENQRNGLYELKDNTSPYSFTNNGLNLLEKTVLPLATEYGLSKPLYGLPGLVFSRSQNLTKAYDEAIVAGLSHEEALVKAEEAASRKGILGLGISAKSYKYTSKYMDIDNFALSKIADGLVDAYTENSLNTSVQEKSYAPELARLSSDVAMLREYEFADKESLAAFFDRNQEKTGIDPQVLQGLGANQPHLLKELELSADEVKAAEDKGWFVEVPKGRYMLAAQAAGVHEGLAKGLAWAQQKPVSQEKAVQEAKLAAWQEKLGLLQAAGDDYLLLAKAKSAGKRYRRLLKDMGKKASGNDE